MKIKEYLLERVKELKKKFNETTNPLDRLILNGKIGELLIVLEIAEGDKE